ncbi:hypothetical protein ES332_A03G142500v1 [Gossypium tomentosum]|uniref:Uncharacterized protein n=1 Tax=Gossypium tomentosum TaxID=34277 RepID=A0A5D2RA74_GOSTO|nr:hypothetical protein ES332_A03G142500v1 [Gossypium tomentosum]TYI36454.1 hypothetical protein ES332_A03G142500v1 [Gossypium tomentosum]
MRAVTHGTFSYSARTSRCDSKISKAYNSEKIQIHIQGARNITTTHWERAVKIHNQATHRNYIWSLDCHYNQ